MKTIVFETIVSTVSPMGLVPEEGVEPSSPNGDQFLRLACIPIPPFRLVAPTRIGLASSSLRAMCNHFILRSWKPNPQDYSHFSHSIFFLFVNIRSTKCEFGFGEQGRSRTYGVSNVAVLQTAALATRQPTLDFLVGFEPTTLEFVAPRSDPNEL